MNTTWLSTRSNYRLNPHWVTANLVHSWKERDGVNGAIYTHVSSTDNFADIKELYYDLQSGELDIKDPTVIRKIAAIYKQYISVSFSQFALAQDKNIYLGFYGKEFLKDTMRFIATGHRHVSPSTFMEMAAAMSSDMRRYVPATGGHITGGYKSSEKDDLFTIDMKQLCNVARDSLVPPAAYSKADSELYLWLTRNGGPEDIVCTMYIVFCCNNL